MSHCVLDGIICFVKLLGVPRCKRISRFVDFSEIVSLEIVSGLNGVVFVLSVLLEVCSRVTSKMVR